MLCKHKCSYVRIRLILNLFDYNFKPNYLNGINIYFNMNKLKIYVNYDVCMLYKICIHKI